MLRILALPHNPFRSLHHQVILSDPRTCKILPSIQRIHIRPWPRIQIIPIRAIEEVRMRQGIPLSVSTQSRTRSHQIMRHPSVSDLIPAKFVKHREARIDIAEHRIDTVIRARLHLIVFASFVVAPARIPISHEKIPMQTVHCVKFFRSWNRGEIRSIQNVKSGFVFDF